MLYYIIYVPPSPSSPRGFYLGGLDIEAGLDEYILTEGQYDCRDQLSQHHISRFDDEFLFMRDVVINTRRLTPFSLTTLHISEFVRHC